MLLGVIAITLGVVVTVLCLRKRNQRNTGNDVPEQKRDTEG